VYYSQLIRIVKCKNCKLRFSDIIINKEILIEHFNKAYKDEDYFRYARNPVFEHIADILINNYPEKLTIMDIGGATGHLASILLNYNKNYKIIVNDISQEACDLASARFKVESICCPLEEIYKFNRKVDILLLIDVLYYVEDIKKAWFSLSACLNKNGILVIRIPNKLWWIEIFQRIKKLSRGHELEDEVLGINPEHVYFFCRSYLNRKLIEHGFDDIKFHPSPSTRSKNPPTNLLAKVVYLSGLLGYYIANGHVCLTPAQIVIARKS
jgi:SAM-dependent methyltransferase